jgi:hypothetical protein
MAAPSSSCIAELGFQDGSGNPVGSTKLVSLITGESDSLTLNGNTILRKKVGARMEVPQIVVPEGTTPRLGSVAVIDNLTGQRHRSSSRHRRVSGRSDFWDAGRDPLPDDAAERGGLSTQSLHRAA